MKRLRPRLTYANVVSTLAFIIALGAGSAFAAGQLAPKSVGAKQLRPGAVTADKIRKNAVTAPKIEALAVKAGKLAGGAVSEVNLANGAVGTAKLAAGSVTGEKIANDAVTGVQIEESSLGQVPTANRANSATTAESANPAAFAAVNQEAEVDTSLSKGGIGVAKGAENGIYCVTVPSFSPRGAPGPPSLQRLRRGHRLRHNRRHRLLPRPQVEVQTFNAGSRAKEPFYVLLYR